MSDPTFSDDEARRILARATERQHRVEEARLESGDALTLDELAAIAEEVDLDPSQVRAAARELVRHRNEAPTKTFLGAPTEVRATRVLPDGISDSQWERMVGVFREHFGGHGVVSQFGDVREWALAIDHGTLSEQPPLQLRLEPGEDGTLVTFRRPIPLLSRAELAVGPIFAAAFAGFFLIGDFPSSAWALVVLIALLALLPILGTPTYGRWQAGKVEAVLDVVGDKIELIGREGDG